MNIFRWIKIKKELKNFREFKKNYKFDYKEIKKNDDGTESVDGICIKDECGEIINSENDIFINVGYANKGSSLAKCLSNLFPYKFYFKGFFVDSVESVIQSLKFKDKKNQRLVFDYSGLNSNRVKACSDYDWKISQTVFFQGMQIERDSRQYDEFIDEIYCSLIQNNLFRNALKNVGNRYILHSIGNENKKETLLSRYEFERELNCIKDYVLLKK